MAETQAPLEQPKSKREQTLERLRKKYPETDFKDEDSVFGKINEDYAEHENQLNQYKEREGRITDLFSKDPRSAQFIVDMAKGKDPWLAIIERLGIDGITDIMNDPTKQEEYAKANEAYVQRLAKEKTLEEEYQKNFAESMDLLERIQQERKLGDDTIDAAMELVIRIANEAIVGKFTEETIGMALNAITHDADVENANSEGVIAGRNAQIEEKLRKPKAGDGIPHLAGSNNNPAPQEKRGHTIFDYANAAK